MFPKRKSKDRQNTITFFSYFVFVVSKLNGINYVYNFQRINKETKKFSTNIKATPELLWQCLTLTTHVNTLRFCNVEVH